MPNNNKTNSINKPLPLDPHSIPVPTPSPTHHRSQSEAKKHCQTTVRTSYFHTRLSQKTSHSPHISVMEVSPRNNKKQILLRQNVNMITCVHGQTKSLIKIV